MRFRPLLAAGLASLLAATAFAGGSDSKAAHRTAAAQQLRLVLTNPRPDQPCAPYFNIPFGIQRETHLERQLRKADYLPVMRPDLLPVAAFSSQYRADGIPEPRGEVYDRTVREIAGRASSVLVSEYSKGFLAPIQAVQHKVNDALAVHSINIRNNQFGLHMRAVVNFNSKKAIGIETKIRLATVRMLAELYPSGFQIRVPALTVGKGTLYLAAYRSFDHDVGSGAVVMYRCALSH